jgi:hypothetical protein
MALTSRCAVRVSAYFRTQYTVQYTETESFSSRFVYLQLFQQLGWEQVAALTEDGQKYTEYISHMQDLLQANGITFVVNRKFPRDREKASMFKVWHVDHSPSQLP